MRTLSFLAPLLLLLAAPGCRTSTPPDPTPTSESAEGSLRQKAEKQSRGVRFVGKARPLRKGASGDAGASSEN